MVWLEKLIVQYGYVSINRHIENNSLTSKFTSDEFYNWLSSMHRLSFTFTAAYQLHVYLLVSSIHVIHVNANSQVLSWNLRQESNKLSTVLLYKVILIVDIHVLSCIMWNGLVQIFLTIKWINLPFLCDFFNHKVDRFSLSLWCFSN